MKTRTKLKAGVSRAHPPPHCPCAASGLPTGKRQLSL